MPEVKQPLVLNDIFISARADELALRNLLPGLFDIPATNVFLDDEDTSQWNDKPYSAFIYSYKGGEIGWKLELTVARECDLVRCLERLSSALGVELFYDTRGTQNDDRVDMYNPRHSIDAARLIAREDTHGNICYEIKRNSLDTA